MAAEFPELTGLTDAHRSRGIYPLLPRIPSVYCFAQVSSGFGAVLLYRVCVGGGLSRALCFFATETFIGTFLYAFVRDSGH